MKVTIIGQVVTVTKEGKKGPYTKHTQEAMMETKGFRQSVEFEVERPDKGYAPGEYSCDVESQMQPGRFGPELPRFYKLVPVIADAKARTA